MSNPTLADRDRTYVVPTYKLPELRDLYEKLRAKAAKLGVEPPEMEVLDEPTCKYAANPLGEAVRIPCVKVRASCKPVRAESWVFCAYLEMSPEGNRIYAMEELPAWCRHVEATCQHCQLERRRKGTYIVRHDVTGEYKQVGSTCVEDFIGNQSAARAAAACQSLRDLHEVCLDSEAGGNPVSPLKAGVMIADLLCFCLEDIARTGYLSRDKAEGTGRTPTGEMSFRLMVENDLRLKVWPDLGQGEVLKRHSAMAEQIVSYWASAPVEKDFDHNASVLAKRGYAYLRDANLVAAMASIYARRLADQARAAGLRNEHVGVVGQKVDVTVVVDAIVPCQGLFPSTLYLMRDPENRQLKWFSTSSSTGMELGRRYRLCGTVKKHDDRGGERSTLLTRCKASSAQTLTA